MSDSKSDSKPKSKSAHFIVGGLIFVAAVASVFIFKKDVVPEEEPLIVRPISSMVIETNYAAMGRKYPGKVSAGQQVTLSFQVPGIVLQRPINRGDEVKAGELLMSLDKRDFENDLKSAIAERDRSKSLYERTAKAAETGGVSKQEVDNAKATFDQAVATVGIREKALEDTELRAKFDGRIGNIFVEQFQTVQPKQAVLSLNDLATIEIDISVPESDIAASNPEARRKSRLVATFDFFPGEEFEVTLKEFTAEADPTTQTFTATLTMPRPEDKSILPGMTATVTSFTPQEFLGEDADGFPVPLDAVPVQVSEDGTENWFVWKMKDTGNGTFTVHRTEIVVGEVAGNTIVVREGLARGDRIALAGVNILTEGREVRLLESRSDPRNSNAGSGGTAANNAGSPAVAGE